MSEFSNTQVTPLRVPFGSVEDADSAVQGAIRHAGKRVREVTLVDDVRNFGMQLPHLILCTESELAAREWQIAVTLLVPRQLTQMWVDLAYMGIPGSWRRVSFVIKGRQREPNEVDCTWLKLAGIEYAVLNGDFQDYVNLPAWRRIACATSGVLDLGHMGASNLAAHPCSGVEAAHKMGISPCVEIKHAKPFRDPELRKLYGSAFYTTNLAEVTSVILSEITGDPAFHTVKKLA